MWAKAYGKGALLSGYRLTARADDPKRLADLSRLRVFAVVDGRASELKPSPALSGMCLAAPVRALFGFPRPRR